MTDSSGRFLRIEGDTKPRHVYGWKRGAPDPRDFLAEEPGWLSRMKMPSMVDNEKICNVVEDQGAEGSCVANAWTDVMESLNIKNGEKIVQLSRQWLYSKGRQRERTPLHEDSGMRVTTAAQVTHEIGIVSEQLYPYSNPWNQLPSPTLDADAANIKVGVYYRCPSLLTIKACLAQGFNLAGGTQLPMGLDEKFHSTGIIPMPTRGWDGGHGVMFCGYDDSTQLLKFKNSWGPGFGKHGYGFLPYAYVTNKWADEFITARTQTGGVVEKTLKMVVR